MTDLIAEYQALRHTEESLYDPDNFPGSKAWLRHADARRACREFEAAHPEVIAAVKTARQDPAYMADPSSLYNRILRGED
ncbi:hypothetical protein [Acidocella sp.]|jgi:hypothetical protein|uniref:hypothetical protein n=1 Tax=Acidocella sp. TaxID=50710 RepID=UPI002F42CE4C